MKFPTVDFNAIDELSPSPRRAWIEILGQIVLTDIKLVALPTEGVD